MNNSEMFQFLKNAFRPKNEEKPVSNCMLKETPQ